MKNRVRSLVCLSALAVSPFALSTGASLDELERRCQDAREAKLAPLREAAIEECVASRRTTRTREDCARLYEDFGQAAATAGGNARPAMFMDLPECVEYIEARDNQQRSSSRR